MTNLVEVRLERERDAARVEAGLAFQRNADLTAQLAEARRALEAVYRNAHEARGGDEASFALDDIEALVAAALAKLAAPDGSAAPRKMPDGSDVYVRVDDIDHPWPSDAPDRSG